MPDAGDFAGRDTAPIATYWGLRRMLNIIFLIKDLCLRLPCFIAAVHLHNPNFYLPDVEGKMFTAAWSGMWIFLPKQM